MKTLLSLVFVLGIYCTATAHAMPASAFGRAQPGLATQVSSGCGIGVRRGPFNGCAPVYVYGGYYGGHHHGYRRGYYRGYRDAYYNGPYFRFDNDQDVIAVDKGFCGFGSYLSCSHGLCWRFCY
jgi:hypothetical protein